MNIRYATPRAHVPYMRFIFYAFGFLALGMGTSAGAHLAPPLRPTLAMREGTTHVTAEWLVSQPNTYRTFSSLQWVDKSTILYSMASDETADAHEIERLDTTTHLRTKLGVGAHPKASPDGIWIAFVHLDQLWLMRSDGSDRRCLSTFQNGLKGVYGRAYEYAWAPDSHRLAVCYQTTSCPVTPFEDRKDTPVFDPSKTSAILATDMRTHDTRTQIDLVDTRTLEWQKLANVQGQLGSLSWHPDGKELLFMRIDKNFFRKSETTLESLSVSDARLKVLLRFDGLQRYLDPVCSPDGKEIAITFDAENPAHNFMPSLAILSYPSTNEPTTVSIRRLTHEMKVYHPQWSKDKATIFFMRLYGPYSQICSADVQTQICRQLTHEALMIRSYAPSPDGSKLAWCGQDAQGRYCLQVGTTNPDTVEDLLIQESAQANMALSEVREVEWDVPDYPVPMRGLLILPLQYKNDTKYPLIVDIHGGGPGASILMMGAILNSTPLEWHHWAAKGYAVFVPEFRSSCCFGSLAITRDYRQYDLINKDIEDIIAGVDWLIQEGIVDPQRMACIGYSSGARRANWLTVATHRFSTVISKEGWADDWLVSGVLFLNDSIHPVLAPENHQKNSCLFHALGTSTPTLFLMGNSRLGGVDPFDTVRWLYNALKVQGVKTEYVQYPDEGHEFQRPANRLDALERVSRWLDENCN